MGLHTVARAHDAHAVSLESMTLHVSRGPALTIVGGSDIRVARSTFVRGGAAGEPALSIRNTAGLSLWRNVFGNYGNELIRGVTAAERDALLGAAQSVVF